MAIWGEYVENEKPVNTDMKAEEGMKVSIYHVKRDQYQRFVQWCREHVGGRYDVALTVLMDNWDMSRNLSQMNKRMDDLEAKASIKVEQPKEEVKEEKVRKTFGKKIEVES